MNRSEKGKTTAPKGNTRIGTLKKVLFFVGRYRVLLICSLILAIVSVLLQLYVPILFGDAIDEIAAPGQVHFDAISGILLQVLVLVILSGAATWLMGMLNNHMTYHTVQDVRERAIRRIQTLPLSYLDRHSAGDIVSRVITDVDILSDGLLLGFSQLFSGVVTIAATLVFMFSKNVWITLLVILLTPLSFLVARFISSHTFQMFLKQGETRGKQTALIEELIGGQKIVRAFGYEEEASARFSSLNNELREYSQKAVFYSSLTNPSTRFINSIVYACVALTGAYMILHGALSVGGLSVLLAYANQYMKPFNDISSVITELQNALACADRVFSLLEETPETPDESRTLSDVKGHVTLEDISFSYDPQRKLIRGLSLDAKPGMRVALVGPTGCGKTTFINLLMRFYDVDDGQIRIDGVPVKSISRRSLRSSYGMVLQDTWIRYGTVRENIRIGKPDATDEEILHAAKLSHSLEFIRRLPNGLDTVLNGDSLSQGQRQLLCITRVMLALPPMLILDEATSSIDTRTEVQIQEAFDRLMQGRTSFIVAHRLSTIRHADRILVMKDGDIIEQGTHTQLMDAGGFYCKLYNSQFAGNA